LVQIVRMDDLLSHHGLRRRSIQAIGIS